MSEYQYYEFRAVDRPLSAADQRHLRDLSTRATITATSFVNSYDWGDFKGDPDRLMERYFDLFLYLANWGTRRLSVRLPARIVDAAAPTPNFAKLESANIRRKGEHLILDIRRDETDAEDWRDSEEWLTALAPLRTAALEGDPSIFYLAWLLAVDGGEVSDGALEPPIGLSPISPAAEAFAEFFGMDWNLIEAAAGAKAPDGGALPSALAQRYIRALDEEEKARLLLRLHDGDDPHLGAELRQRVRASGALAPARRPSRSVAELRALAAGIAAERARKAEKKAAAERRREETRQDEERKRRLEILARRGDAAWRDVEQGIERRNDRGYEEAVVLLSDLRALAEGQGRLGEFMRRLGEIRLRHAKKGRFLERLPAAGLD